MFEPLSYLEEKIRLTEDLKSSILTYYRKYLETSKDLNFKQSARDLFWKLNNSLTDLSDSHHILMSITEDKNE